MAKVYEFLGMTVGVIVHGQSPKVRKRQYDCYITYGTNNEFGFDYLKDNMVIHVEGKGVHVVTVNDYLAKRDRDQMAKVYEFLGMTVGVIVHGQSPKVRKRQYDCDITYGTNNEFGFDYLKDNMVIHEEQMVQRELNYAIVDEVDSILVDEARTPLIISGPGDKSTHILVDEARTPLIISGPGDKSTHLYTDANTFVNTLKPDDYEQEEKDKAVSLTESGVKKAEMYFNVDNITDVAHTELYHHINQALKAHVIMKRDVDYVEKDGEIVIVDEFTGRLMFGRRYSDGLHQAIEAKEGLKVQRESKTLATITFQEIVIVDEFTGRLMFGRRYSDGLHQAIEAKEGLKVQRESKTLATITFQNYFRMYNKLSGMTGTAKTEEEEFKAIYKMELLKQKKKSSKLYTKWTYSRYLQINQW